jgi:hypothetical protein
LIFLPQQATCVACVRIRTQLLCRRRAIARGRDFECFMSNEVTK